ncbi:hypothetical protein A2V80_03205 [Candidatus Woesebacteria bacterium RBG_16_39_8b]|uniref:Probable transcriptional regulatory protein A2V80_03205 n=1 Tax=Candidatus Woesebacteria bacterium RBG_16_39_8b TaxID=1802482 RepID=A0A1F7XHC5_9BACT|nr:MAG: hypothetical protein A2V80_03205 [Candidatus Woesebacteria bacterium RBG_16_39_8b]
MSGHSKWSTIKRKKEATDMVRGKLFSKISKTIATAVKGGGSNNPETNSKLRVAIEEARAANMPKANVERALKKGGEGEISEFTYEGFGPGGICVIVEGATDNRNRTGQEIKGIFERGGGSLAGPGAVSFNFKPKCMFLVDKKGNTQNQMLELIDIGVEDVEETDDGIEIYVDQDKYSKTKDDLESKGQKTIKSELVQNPINYHTLDNLSDAKRALAFLEMLEDHEDVYKVFANVNIPDGILAKIKSQ